MASGDLLAELQAKSLIPGTSAGTASATLDTIAMSTPGGQLLVLDFDGSTQDEVAFGKFSVPSVYDSTSGFTVEIDYATDGTVTNAIQFEVSMGKSVEGDAIGSEGMGTLTDITDTPLSTANDFQTTPTGAITHANAGSPAVGDLVRVRIARDFNHAANADDVQFITARITQT